MPAYNAALYIRAAIESVQLQTMRAIEIIVIDDFSTDQTAAIVQKLSNQDGRVRYERMAQNVGPAASRNRGLELARGEWVALLDADDRFHPERLEKLLKIAISNSVDMISDNVLLITESDGTTRHLIPENILSEVRQLSFLEFIRGCYYDKNTLRRSNYVFMHPIFRKAFLDLNELKYNSVSRNGEDFLFYLDCLAANAKWYIIPDPMYFYSIRDGSLTEIVSLNDRQLMVEKIQELLEHPRVRSDKILAEAVVRHYKLISPYYYYQSFREAFRKGSARDVFRVFASDKAAAILILRQLGGRAPQYFLKVIRVKIQSLKSI